MFDNFSRIRLLIKLDMLAEKYISDKIVNSDGYKKSHIKRIGISYD